MAALALMAHPLAAQDAPREVAPDDEDIVVLGRKLEDWRGKMRKRDGKNSCRTTKSSGDREIDAMACAAMVQCLDRIQPKIDAISAKKPPRSEHAALSAPLNREGSACLKETYEAGLQRLSERRAAGYTE